ncbi:carbohydrate kinase family protein [Candidatus Woesebacteria bacterium]|nr:carbohydrate kinase family protein [Candidatus Woesebacteria bacterium]
MQKPKKVVLSGSISLDRIMNFGGSYADLIKPDKIHVLSLSVLIDNLTHSRGGVATNIAYNLALLGDHPIVLGSVGKDALDYISDLKKIGVNTEHIHQSNLPTATFTVLTDKNNNQVGGFYPGAMSDAKDLSLKTWSNTNTLAVVSANDPSLMARLVTEAREYSLELIYDPSQQVSNCTGDDLKAGVMAARILMVNDYELSVLCTKSGMTEEEVKKLVPIVITTLGKDGSELSGKGLSKPIHVPAISGIKPVDPTGAGDAYRGGFIYGYSRGWDLETCMQLGSVMASFTIELAGTQTHHPDKHEINTRYKNTFNKNLNL